LLPSNTYKKRPEQMVKIYGVDIRTLQAMIGGGDPPNTP